LLETGGVTNVDDRNATGTKPKMQSFSSAGRKVHSAARTKAGKKRGWNKKPGDLQYSNRKNPRSE